MTLNVLWLLVAGNNGFLDTLWTEFKEEQFGFHHGQGTLPRRIVEGIV